MVAFLHHREPSVSFRAYRGPFFQIQFTKQPELKCLLKENSSSTNHSPDWDYCFPTAFGWGLVADWLEDHRDHLTFAVIEGKVPPQQALDHLIEDCRRLFQSKQTNPFPH